MLMARAFQGEDELHEFLRDFRFQRLDAAGAPIEGPDGQLPITAALIDSGDQTAYIYELVNTWQDVDLRPSKGVESNRDGLKMRQSIIKRDPKSRRAMKRPVVLNLFENGFFKDSLARYAAIEEPGPGYLHLPSDTPRAWFDEFAAEHKAPERSRGKKGRSGRTQFVWRPRTEGAANHFWDCEVLQTLWIDPQLLNLRNLPDPGAPPVRAPQRRVGRMTGVG
jgi:hypothetical protein